MINLIKADFKKIFFLSSYRFFIGTTIVLSLLFGLILLFTIGVTQGKQLTGLSPLEVIDISFLGIDVAAIMLIIFIAMFVSKDLSAGAVHTNLAIMPVRRKYFLSKMSFASILSVLISLVVILLLIVIDQMIISTNHIGDITLINSQITLKIVGSVIMVLFYSLLSVAGAFYTHSTAGGIVFSLSVMLLPALIKMFPANVADHILMVFPENSLHVLIDSHSVNISMTGALITLLAWIIISCFLGLYRFKRVDY